MLKTLKILIPFFLLNACSTMPSGPSVLALPGTGKDYNHFHNDDLMCRQLAHEQIATAPEDPDSKEEGQQNYDINYIQCMYGKGHRVPVPGELMYDTRQEWHTPPPPDMQRRLNLPARNHPTTISGQTIKFIEKGDSGL